MSIRLSRREALRLGGLSAFSLFHPPFLAGCASKDSSGSSSLPPLVYDPNVSWWMQHNYGPVAEERYTTALSVEGAIPPELTGLYVRNGSNPKHGDPGHWFLGSGMLHGVRLEGGKALHYRNRWVDTPLLERVPVDGGVTLPTLTDTASNVSVVSHAGRLLALGEVGLPYEVSAADLSTIGAYDFGGKLQTFMTAHPKLDPVTGEMLMFGYYFGRPYVTYHRVNASGALVETVPIDSIPTPVMMHDFQVTETRVVFMDLPIVLDVGLAASGNPFPFRWDAKNGARIGLMSRTAPQSGVQWITVDPCFIFHTLNAYDDPSGKVILEAMRYPELWVNGPAKFDAFPTLHRYTIDPVAGTATLDALDDRLAEFPQIDRRKAGRKNRYGYSLWLADPNGDGYPTGVRGIIKYDRDTATSTVHTVDPALQLDEAFFVPAAGSSPEDGGWLLSYAHDRRTDRSELYIVDASRLTAPPVARIKLPFRIPFGFHGAWSPG